MPAERRARWSRHIDQVIRSKHYTWIAEGLGGVPLEQALVAIATDIMHICKREGLSCEQLLKRSATQFEHEEAQLAQTQSEAA